MPKTREELIKEKEQIEAQIKELERQEDFALYKEAIRSDCEAIRFLAEAMLHVRQGVKPSVEKLGYELANLDYIYKSNRENEETNALYRRLIRKLDITDYVFAHTHYDECSNGHFFRRS